MASQEITTDQAFLLRSVDYGEGHRILSFLMAHHGRIGLVVYSAYQSRKRSLGILDFLNCLQMEFKPHSPQRSLGELIHCELNRSFDGVKQSYQNSIAALSWIKLISQILPEGGDVPGLFQLLYESLHALEYQPAFRIDLIFRRKFLTRLGYHLELSRCARCTELSPCYRFLPQMGGLLCENCHREANGLLVKNALSDHLWDFESAKEEFQEIQYSQAKSILDQSYHYFLGISAV